MTFHPLGKHVKIKSIIHNIRLYAVISSICIFILQTSTMLALHNQCKIGILTETNNLFNGYILTAHAAFVLIFFYIQKKRVYLKKARKFLCTYTNLKPWSSTWLYWRHGHNHNTSNYIIVMFCYIKDLVSQYQIQGNQRYVYISTKKSKEFN